MTKCILYRFGLLFVQVVLFSGRVDDTLVVALKLGKLLLVVLADLQVFSNPRLQFAARAKAGYLRVQALLLGFERVIQLILERQQLGGVLQSLLVQLVRLL